MSGNYNNQQSAFHQKKKNHGLEPLTSHYWAQMIHVFLSFYWLTIHSNNKGCLSIQGKIMQIYQQSSRHKGVKEMTTVTATATTTPKINDLTGRTRKNNRAPCAAPFFVQLFDVAKWRREILFFEVLKTTQQ